MNDLTMDSRLTQIANLKETPLSLHLASLMRAERISPNPDNLFVAQVVSWAMENLAADPAWAQAVDNAVGLAVLNDPQAVYENLEDCFYRVLPVDLRELC